MGGLQGLKLRRVIASPGVAGTAEVLAALGEALRGGPPILPSGPDDGQALDDALLALGSDLGSDPVPNGDVALVVATSGSTGTPRLVALSASALRASADAALARLGGRGRWLLAVPPTHIAGIQVLVRSLVADTVPETVDTTGGFRPAAFVTATRRLGAGRRYVSLVPTQVQRLLADPEGARVLAGFDAVLVGGAATEPHLLAAARAAGVNAITTYGSSETAGGCVYDGVPLPGVELGFEPDGRIRLGGPTLASGYLGDPVGTAAAFVDGWFVTSDLGRLGPSGGLEVLGRADDVVQSGGVNVALAAVTSVLAGAPGVHDAAVVAVPDAEWGNRIVGYVVLEDGAGTGILLDLAELVRSELGRAAVPRQLVALPDLPRLALGKVDRRELQRLATEQAQGSP